MPAPRATLRRIADVICAMCWAAAITVAIGLTPAQAVQPEGGEATELDRLLRMLGLESPARAAPPRGLSLWGSAEEARADGAVPDAGAPGAWRKLEATDALPQRIVLLVHGLDEPGDIFHTLAPKLVEAGHTPLYFEYPNDQGAAASAAELAEALRTLAGRGVRQVDIVAHSMGGLIARDVLTREAWYAGAATAEEFPEIGRLIMLGTPNAGSPWARLRGLSELREQAMRFTDDPRADRLLAFLDDGAGEAGRDLLPGSTYLKELNGRRLPQVRITVVVGQVAPGAPGAAGNAADEAAGLAAEGLRWLLGPGEEAEGAARAAGAAADELRRALEIIEQSVGDGVVPAESAVLAGVDDVVYVEANHRGMIRTIPAEQAAREAVGLGRVEPPAIAIVLNRLGRGDHAGKDGGE